MGGGVPDQCKCEVWRQTPLGLDFEVPQPSAAWSGGCGSRAFADVGTAALGTVEAGPVGERRVVAAAAGRVPALAQKGLGTAPRDRECFCATAGAVNDQTVQEYIEGRKWDEDVGGFQVTAPESS